jgi:hypothetical protein
MSDTRATLYVPAPSPETSMSLGKAWSGTSWNSAGLCVNTQGRVWLDACGDGTSSSTFACFSNGGEGVGQLLAQSLSSNLYLFSKESTLVSAEESLFFGGAKGVKLVAGHGIMERVAGSLMSWEVGGTSLERVKPDDDDPSSDHASSYVDTMEAVEKWWSVADLSLGAAMTVSELVRYAMGVRGVGSAASAVMSVAGLTAAARIAGGATSMGRAATDEVGGLNLNALGSVNLATLGFVTVQAGAGITLGGINTGGYGIVEAAMIGGLSASIKSNKEAKIDGATVEITAGKDVLVASTTYKQKSYGMNIQIGALGGEYLTQLPTQTITAAAATIDAYTYGDFALAAGDTVSMSANEIHLAAGSNLQITGPGYEITLSSSGLVIAVAGGQTKISGGPTQTVASVGAGAMKLSLSASGATLGANASSIGVSAAGVCQMKGMQFTFL